MTDLSPLVAAPGAHSIPYFDPSFPDRRMILHAARPRHFDASNNRINYNYDEFNNHHNNDYHDNHYHDNDYNDNDYHDNDYHDYDYRNFKCNRYDNYNNCNNIN